MGRIPGRIGIGSVIVIVATLFGPYLGLKVAAALAGYDIPGQTLVVFEWMAFLFAYVLGAGPAFLFGVALAVQLVVTGKITWPNILIAAAVAGLLVPAWQWVHAGKSPGVTIDRWAWVATFGFLIPALCAAIPIGFIARLLARLA